MAESTRALSAHWIVGTDTSISVSTFRCRIVLDGGTCPAGDFLELLRQRDKASHKSLVNLLSRHAEHGPIRNEKKSRAIKGKENLWEFKTRQGDRIPFFYLAGGKTVLTHGFHKGALARTEYRKAEAIRDRYLQGG